ncbi:MAG: Ig-like domain-containing protein [Myxococcaceae bacterium]|nr:Ig-like domain-containing protein [Myxococcaceae bacterium]
MNKTLILVGFVLSASACTPPAGRDPVPRLDVLQVVPGSVRTEAGGVVQFGALRIVGPDSTNVTGEATWRSNAPSVLTISATGEATLEGPGVATVTATFDGKSGSSEVIVTGRVVAVELGELSLPVGVTRALSGVLITEDDRRRDFDGHETFGSSDDRIASVSATGEVKGEGAGTATVTLTRDGRTSSRQVTVVDTPLMAVTPAADPGARLPSEATVHVSVTGTFANGMQEDITSLFAVSASDDTAVTLDGASVTASAVDTDTPVTLTFTGAARTVAAGKTATLPLTVVAAPLSALKLTAPMTASTKGESSRLQVVGTYGSLEFPVSPDDVTTDPEGIASVARDGTISWLAPGTVTFTAVLGEVEGTASTTVSDAALTGVTIGGGGALMPGGTLSLSATAAFGAVTQDVTSLVLWKSTAPAIATVSNVEPGQVTAKAAGPVTIEAYYRGVRAGTLTLTVAP